MHTLPHLPYEYNALEPVIDTLTMQIHHTRHHQTYIDKLNAGLSSYPQYEGLSVNDLLTQFDTLPDALKPIVRNHGGGHANHSLFWKIMCPTVESEQGKVNSAQLMGAIDQSFGSFDAFVEQFTSAAVNQFGSGRAWLVNSEQGTVNNEKGGLKIIATPNQDSPLMQGLVPLLGLDVREHAYYLKYQNKRADYIKAWFGIVNWKIVEQQMLSS